MINYHLASRQFLIFLDLILLRFFKIHNKIIKTQGLKSQEFVEIESPQPEGGEGSKAQKEKG